MLQPIKTSSESARFLNNSAMESWPQLSRMMPASFSHPLIFKWNLRPWRKGWCFTEQIAQRVIFSNYYRMWVNESTTCSFLAMGAKSGMISMHLLAVACSLLTWVGYLDYLWVATLTHNWLVHANISSGLLLRVLQYPGTVLIMDNPTCSTGFIIGDWWNPGKATAPGAWLSFCTNGMIGAAS